MKELICGVFIGVMFYCKLCFIGVFILLVLFDTPYSAVAFQVYYSEFSKWSMVPFVPWWTTVQVKVTTLLKSMIIVCKTAACKHI